MHFLHFRALQCHVVTYMLKCQIEIGHISFLRCWNIILHTLRAWFRFISIVFDMGVHDFRLIAILVGDVAGRAYRFDVSVSVSVSVSFVVTLLLMALRSVSSFCTCTADCIIITSIDNGLVWVAILFATG